MQTKNHYGISHLSHCKLVKYPSQLLIKILQCKDYRSLNPLSQMHHCKLQGLTKAFMATFNSLQTNDPLSLKIHHLDCLFRPTALYKFITQSAIKKKKLRISSPFYTVWAYFNTVYQVGSRNSTPGGKNFELSLN